MSQRIRVAALAVSTAALSVAAPATAAQGPPPAWVDQFGTSGYDAVDDIAADAQLAYAVGRVGADQALPGQTSMGSIDTFVRSYRADGTVAWTRQTGTSGFDGFPHVAPTQDGVVVAGVTTGAFPGQTRSGLADVFVQRYSADGTLLSTTQFGNDSQAIPFDVAAAGPDTYVFGFTDDVFAGQTSAGGFDFFLTRLDAAGQVVWTRQFGTTADDPAVFALGGLAVDATGVYVASSVRNALPDTTSRGGPDAFVRKYDTNGGVLWSRQFGTRCTDLLSDLVARDGSLYVAGLTLGTFSNPDTKRCTKPPEPENDAGGGAATWVQRLDSDGSAQWTAQYGGQQPAGVGFTLAIGLDVDAHGLVVTGEAVRPRTGGIGGEASTQECPVGFPEEDIMAQRIGLDGTLGATMIVGSVAQDVPSGVALLNGAAIIGGSTSCALDGEASLGSSDAVVLRAVP